MALPVVSATYARPARKTKYSNTSAKVALLMPPGPVTIASTRPATVVGGAMTLIWESESTLKFDGSTLIDPNATLVAPANDDPVIVTRVPPPTAPTLGHID